MFYGCSYLASSALTAGSVLGSEVCLYSYIASELDRPEVLAVPVLTNAGKMVYNYVRDRKMAGKYEE